MVTVKEAHQRVGKDDKPFISLELIGGLELVQSQNTGRFYATTRRCYVSSTFNLETAKQFIGQKLPGKIVRIQCEPYEFTIPESGEVISLGFRYDFQPEENPAVDSAKTKKMIAAPVEESEEALLEEMS